MKKYKPVLAWVLAILLALTFISAGYPKVIPADSMITRFENWGYTAGFASFIGVVELMGGILVLIPRLSFYATILLAMDMIGAIYTHLSTGIGGPEFAIIALLLAVILAILRFGKRLRLV